MERDPRITWALDHLAAHLAEPLRVATLAACVNLSPSGFAHLFRREVGTSPARYLRDERMRRARLLLERTFLTVKEVMTLVGCTDASHFSRDFKRFHGVAPSELRRMTAPANKQQHPPTEPTPRARAPDIPWKTDMTF
jgi:AraC family transcriptional regulator, arabinose operon regulatory protein